MKRKGFSFACPTLVDDKNEELQFQSFLKIPNTDAERIHNPFPQTAYAGKYNQASTHPLLYLCYLPTIDARQMRNPKKRILTAYYNFITLVHEYTHLVLTDTPAKIFARQVLAWAYTCVDYLLYEKSWNEGNWEIFQIYNNQLTAICEAITPSEELLATAASFEMINSIWREHFVEGINAFCEAITPSEELLATAASFEMINSIWREHFEEGINALQKELENVEKQAINAHQPPLLISKICITTPLRK
jgi:predicted outer membrane lipoprotein